MDMNKMMTDGIFTMNDKHTQSEHELSTLQNHAIMFFFLNEVGLNILEMGYESFIGTHFSKYYHHQYNAAPLMKKIFCLVLTMDQLHSPLSATFYYL